MDYKFDNCLSLEIFSFHNITNVELVGDHGIIVSTMHGWSSQGRSQKLYDVAALPNYFEN